MMKGYENTSQTFIFLQSLLEIKYILFHHLNLCGKIRNLMRLKYMSFYIYFHKVETKVRFLLSHEDLRRQHLMKLTGSIKPWLTFLAHFVIFGGKDGIILFRNLRPSQLHKILQSSSIAMFNLICKNFRSQNHRSCFTFHYYSNCASRNYCRKVLLILL